MKTLISILLSSVLLIGRLAAAESSPAEMISDFRLKHGEGRVSIDATLNQIALDQAKAMAAKDSLDHDVLGSFHSRVAPAKSGLAAENIAYGYDSFEKTLELWIGSTGHRHNLLLHDASRVGIASARTANTRRTYWAMVIAGGYEPQRKAGGKKTSLAPKERSSEKSCRIAILGLCL